MSELKSCPFCGNNEPTIRIFRGKNGWRDRYAVICRYDEGGCGAESGLYHYETEAVEAWNRREIEQPDRGYVEQIKWERDLAIQQLKDLGYGLGEKPRTQDYKTDHGYMWLCPKCGLPVHSDFEKCVRCGYERLKDAVTMTKDGTLDIEIGASIDNVKRILLSQKGTTYRALFYRD